MAYTKVNKPTTNIWVNVVIPPQTIGEFDIGFFDEAQFDVTGDTNYSKVAKPTANIWVKVNKPT